MGTIPQDPLEQKYLCFENKKWTTALSLTPFLLGSRALKKWLWVVCELYLNKVVTKFLKIKKSDWVVVKDKHKF